MNAAPPSISRPVRLRRSQFGPDWVPPEGVVNVGPGSKWKNPFRRADLDALRGEADIERAYQQGGWRQAANLVYREYLKDENLDPTELRGKDLVCTCKPDEPCHADVLLELANR
jgi:Domain of unknown function (DUF4326)